MLRFSQWITLSTAIGALQNYIPVILLSRATAPGGLASYNIGLALTGGFSIFLTAVMSVTMPEAIKSAAKYQQRSYVKAVLPAGLLFACAVLPVTWFGAPLASHFVGKQFLAGIQVFRLLTAAQVVLVLTNPIQFLLYGMGRVNLCTAGDAIIAVSFWLVGTACLSVWGVPGLALALLLCQSLTKLALVGFTLKLVFRPQEAGSSEVIPDAAF
jgi:O-antigen/teichoic acid export membrane protein